MGAGLNTGAVEANVASIGGAITPNYADLKSQRYDGTAYADFAVPSGKYWVLMGYTCHTSDWITATISSAGCNIWNYNVPFGAQMPIRMNYGDSLRVSGDASFSYFEYDV